MITTLESVGKTSTKIDLAWGGDFWVGRCEAPPRTLTLFKTKIADFPTLFKTAFQFLIPGLRHLTRKIL